MSDLQAAEMQALAAAMVAARQAYQKKPTARRLATLRRATKAHDKFFDNWYATYRPAIGGYEQVEI